MAASLPPEIEICARVLNGYACTGVLFKPTPDTRYCYRCGSTEVGVVYVRKEERRFFLDEVGEYDLYAVPVDKREEWRAWTTEWTHDGASEVPSYAILVGADGDGFAGLTFASPEAP